MVAMAVGISVAVDDRAGLEAVGGATVRAAGLAGMGDVEEDARMHAPQGRFRARAVHGQVFGPDFDGVVGGDGGLGGGGHE